MPNPRTLRALTSAVPFSFLLAACEGEVGPAGAPGPRGPAGAAGPAGHDGQDGRSAVLDPALPPLEKLLAGAGGRSALEGLAAYTARIQGRRFVPLESAAPELGPLPANVHSTTVTRDLRADGLRIDTSRTVLFLGFNARQSYSEILAGQLGYLAGSESVFGAPGGEMPSARWAALRRQHALLHPQELLQRALRAPGQFLDAGLQILDGELHHLLLAEDEIHPLALYVHAATGQLRRLSTVETSPLLRDVALDVYYQDWRPVAEGPAFPRLVVVALDGEVLLEEQRTAVAVRMEPAGTLFDFPPDAAPVYRAEDAARGARRHQFHLSFAGVGIPLDAEQRQVVASALAPGVWFLTGASHNTLVVEQSGGVVVVEAPLDEARSEAVLAWIAAELPGKPVRDLVLSHHHEDHSAGVRRFAAHGARVVVGEVAAPLFRRVFRAPSTVEPDALSRAPRPVELVAVPRGGRLTLPDAARPVEVFAVETAHAADMLGVVAGGVLFAADIYSPGNPAFPPGPTELYDSAVAAGQVATTVAGAHGGSGSWEELRVAAGR